MLYSLFTTKVEIKCKVNISNPICLIKKIHKKLNTSIDNDNQNEILTMFHNIISYHSKKNYNKLFFIIFITLQIKI